MTYQEKLAVIEEGSKILSGGVSWDEWQDQISRQGLNQKDIDHIGVKVITAIDNIFGDPIEAQLESAGVAVLDNRLHVSVHNRIAERRSKKVKGKLLKKISADLLAGHSIDQIVATNGNALVDEQLLEKAVQKARAKEKIIVQNQQQKAKDTSPVSLVIGVIALTMGLGLTYISGGHTLYYGAILIGALLIIRFAVGVFND